MLKYQFSPEQLASPRLPGISAFMRIKNGADFLEVTIRSHLPYFDEIVACYNDCNDETPAILQRLANEFPNKLRVFHYVPRVYPVLGQEHRTTDASSLHSMANYYNYALAKCQYQVAVKLDDDHLPIAAALKTAVAQVRSDLQRGERYLYSFSGLNLVGTRSSPQVYLNEAFVGTGDIMFFPVDPKLYFIQGALYEQLNYRGLKHLYPKRYLGLLYVHLKHLKTDYGFANLPPAVHAQHLDTFIHNCQSCSLNEFIQGGTKQQLIQQYGRLSFMLRQSYVVKGLHLLLRKQQPLRFQRIERFEQDLALIDWQADVLDWLAPSSQPDESMTSHVQIVVA